MQEQALNTITMHLQVISLHVLSEAFPLCVSLFFAETNDSN